MRCLPFAEKSVRRHRNLRQLTGGMVDRWLAPNISSDKLAGLGNRTIVSIVQFLGTGAGTSEGVAFGPMAAVVHDSLRYLTNTDLHAIAVYLKAGTDRATASPKGLRPRRRTPPRPN